jgi:hypothetical protein
MKGQAGRWLHHLGHVLLAVPLLLGLAVAALAWRLSAEPIAIPALARAISAAASEAAGAGRRVEIGRALLAWEGWHGGAAPVDIRLEGIELREADGQIRAEIPDMAFAIAFRPLLRGVLAPARIELRRPVLHLARDAEGDISLAETGGAEAPERATASLLEALLGSAGDAGRLGYLRRFTIADGTLRVADASLGTDWVLDGLQLDAHRRSAGGVAAEGQAMLRAGAVGLPVRLSLDAREEARLQLDLPSLPTTEIAAAIPLLAPLAQIEAQAQLQAVGDFTLDGKLRDLRLTLATHGGGVLRPRPEVAIAFDDLQAELSATPRHLVLRRARIALPGRAAVTAEGTMEGGADGWQGALRLTLDGLNMTGLARHWPEALAPRSRAVAFAWLPEAELREARLRLDLAAERDLTGWSVRLAQAEAVMEAARLRLPASPHPVALRRAELTLDVSWEALRLQRAVLWLTGGPGAAETALGFTAAADRTPEGWEGTAEATLDRVRFEDLASLWPEGVLTGPREWMTANVTAGEARDGRWRLGWRSAEDLTELRATALSGTVRGEEATVHWLRPIPPVQGVAAEASFGLDEITLRASSGRQAGGDGRPLAVELRSATLRFLFPPNQTDRTEMEFRLAGSVADAVEVLRQPRLHLFDRRPFPFRVAAGDFEGQLSVGFEFLHEIPFEAIRLRSEVRVTDGRLTQALLGRDLEALAVDLTADPEKLTVAGTGQLAGIPLRLDIETDFRPGPPTGVFSRENVTARADAAQLAAIGYGTGGFATGPIAIEARGERRRNGASTVVLRADLRETTLAIPPLRWRKPPGSAGRAEMTLRLQEDRLTGLDGLRIEALDLSARGRGVVRNQRIERVEIQESVFGASRFTGDARPPERDGAAWGLNLRGPIADLRGVFAPGPASAREEAASADGTPLVLDLRFDRVLLGPEREVYAAQLRARTDAASVLREATLRGRTARGTGNFEATLTPRGEARQLRLSAEDGGALLRAMGLVESINGGVLALDASYADSNPGAALSGTAELAGFTVQNAPALGKLLQAVTVFGILEAMQGGTGLTFNRAVVPFTLTPSELRLNDARAFSASLGLTARGRILRERPVLDLEGTIVPAYVLNSLLGNLPVIGRLFSSEEGGGLVAFGFRAQGPPDDATITVNPLTALTPGFLRGLFQPNETGQRPR